MAATPTENSLTAGSSPDVYNDALQYLTPDIEAEYLDHSEMGPSVKAIATFAYVGNDDCPFTYDFQSLRTTLGNCMGRMLMSRMWGANRLEYHLSINIKHKVKIESPATKKTYLISISEPFETMPDDILYSDSIDYAYGRLSEQLDMIENYLDEIADKKYTLEKFKMIMIYDIDVSLENI